MAYRTEPNEPAFACPAVDGQHGTSDGLTKLEYFAAAALQGLLANDWSGYRGSDPDCKKICITAVHYAQALVTALNENE